MARLSVLFVSYWLDIRRRALLRMSRLRLLWWGRYNCTETASARRHFTRY